MNKFIKVSLFSMVTFVLVMIIGQQPVQADTTTTSATTETLATADRQTVTVYPDQGPVNLYDGNGQPVANVALAANTNLATEGTVVINGTKYYRISDDSLVKASDVYVYKMSLLTVQTKKGKYADLVDVHGKTVTNRAAEGATTWKIDRVIQINNENYYRVANDEFIPENNVSVVK